MDIDSLTADAYERYRELLDQHATITTEGGTRVVRIEPFRDELDAVIEELAEEISAAANRHGVELNIDRIPDALAPPRVPFKMNITSIDRWLFGWGAFNVPIRIELWPAGSKWWDWWQWRVLAPEERKDRKLLLHAVGPELPPEYKPWWRQRK